MKIYTSYFAKSAQLPKSMVQIAICLYRPKWYKGFHISALAPSAKLLYDYKCTHDKVAYTAQFCSYLETLNADGIVELLSYLSRGLDVVLLCYERPQDFCHRQLVARWLTEHGYDCSEYEVSTSLKKSTGEDIGNAAQDCLASAT